MIWSGWYKLKRTAGLRNYSNFKSDWSNEFIIRKWNYPFSIWSVPPDDADRRSSSWTFAGHIRGMIWISPLSFLRMPLEAECFRTFNRPLRSTISVLLYSRKHFGRLEASDFGAWSGRRTFSIPPDGCLIFWFPSFAPEIPWQPFATSPHTIIRRSSVDG